MKAIMDKVFQGKLSHLTLILEPYEGGAMFSLFTDEETEA